jgi:probable F420-dependent oxidoreductase
MKDIGKLGVWITPDALSTSEIVKLAQGAEQLGYDTLWYPEGIGYETFSFGSFILSETDRLRAASGIANIYARDAVTAIAGHNSLNRLYYDRFILGLGVSHIPLVEDFRGHNYGKPVASMRAYLDGMEAAELSFDVPQQNVVLAALGPNMLALAGKRTRGAHPYLVTPNHTTRARKILGPDAWLCVEQKVCLTPDVATARNIAASVLELYINWPNYRNNWLSLGFSEEELSGRGSDRFLDAMVLSGSATEVRAGLQAHFDAGADHVCVQQLNPNGSAAVDWKALEAVAEM